MACLFLSSEFEFGRYSYFTDIDIAPILYITLFGVKTFYYLDWLEVGRWMLRSGTLCSMRGGFGVLEKREDYMDSKRIETRNFIYLHQ